jgi:SAM-dependent methyltransferase
MKAYTASVYRFIHETSTPSARQLVPLVMDLVRPRSVVDFGCGTGDWLAVFREHGVGRVLGIDGDWVDRTLLSIPQGDFRVADLGQPVELDQSFECALCLEVMEHIPKDREDVLLDSLTRAAPVVLFSSPIPYQRGVGPDPKNCEWPIYWAKKFAARGYLSIDCLRTQVWEKEDVAWWFAQNVFVAVRKDSLPRFPSLRRESTTAGSGPRALVHPRCFESTMLLLRPENLPLASLLTMVPLALMRKVARRVR